MHSLPVFLRLKGRPVILIGEGEVAQAKRRLLERTGSVVVGEDAAAALAIVVLEDDAAAEAAVARLKARGVMVNATDRPALCDFTLPAIIDRAPVLIAIGTGGASSGLAAALRQRLETILPASLGALAHALFGARADVKARYPDARSRRQAIGAALAEGGALDPLIAYEGGAVEAWLATENTAPTNQIIPITLRSADPDELTLREARLLAQADCVCHTADVPAVILNRARADAVRVLCEDVPDACDHGLCVFISF